MTTYSLYWTSLCRAAYTEDCPRCGGVLAITQDGWRICHSCGYSSPP